ncbi:MAG TPA: PRC-barrel domain-containing protein, partial [Gemmatimonadaceae bacterium]|nr:PRC-barrel domain-containing protein [Gemmatimonadaceae bacterium]
RTMEVKVELLIGRKVCDVNGEKVGRIEEILAERQENGLLVESFLVGTSGLISRLSAWTLVRPLKRSLKERHIYSAYEIPWQDLDLTDPKRPKLRTARKDLHHAR